MTTVKDFQRRVFENYKDNLSLPTTYNYYNGNPIHPIVPLDTCKNNVFIIGAYPTARFASIGSERDVPVGDISGPLSTKKYFDGSRERAVSSGVELEEAYLTPLGINHEQCWITNIVRIFLFKDGHISKYRRLGCSCQIGELGASLKRNTVKRKRHDCHNHWHRFRYSSNKY